MIWEMVLAETVLDLLKERDTITRAQLHKRLSALLKEFEGKGRETVALERCLVESIVRLGLIPTKVIDRYAGLSYTL